MNNDNDLFKQTIALSQHLLDSNRRLVTAESCTGGWVGKILTDLPGSSRWYRGGVISYSNELKQKLLNVSEATLQTHGAVSDAVVREMATGALEQLGGDIAIAISGIAGPDGAQPGKPVGTVWIAWGWRHGHAVHVNARLKLFSGDREEVRRRSVMAALQGVMEL
jgi:nicotinamide-nucleotide amidase